jgi:hypothetical protein
MGVMLILRLELHLAHSGTNSFSTSATDQSEVKAKADQNSEQANSECSVFGTTSCQLFLQHAALLQVTVAFR